MATHVVSVVGLVEVQPQVLHRQHRFARVVREYAQELHQLPRRDVVERHHERVVLPPRRRVAHHLLQESRGPHSVARNELVHRDVVPRRQLRRRRPQAVHPPPRSLSHCLAELRVNLVHREVAQRRLLKLGCNVDLYQPRVLSYTITASCLHNTPSSGRPLAHASPHERSPARTRNPSRAVARSHTSPRERSPARTCGHSRAVDRSFSHSLQLIASGRPLTPYLPSLSGRPLPRQHTTQSSNKLSTHQGRTLQPSTSQGQTASPVRAPACPPGPQRPLAAHS